MKFCNKVGIVTYGSYIPLRRIKVVDIARQWSKGEESIIKGLGILEKSVPAADEDTITMAVTAATSALEKKEVTGIGAIYTGSESHPYAVKSSSAVIGEALGIEHNYTAADLEFACKAGTAAMQMAAGLISSKAMSYALAIGSDTAQSRPGDALEYSAAASAAAFVFGGDDKEIIAELMYSASFTSDTPDFWRREYEHYPMHAGRFTGEPAYFKHIEGAVNLILKESKMKMKDFDHVVLHMPNAAFPKKAAKMLGITDKQLEQGFIVPNLGNTYSACSLTGLSAVLDVAKSQQKVLICSYGSGSGSDAFIFNITKNISKLKRIDTVSEQLDKKKYINYGEYLKLMRKINID